MDINLRVLEDNELEKIHNYSLKILMNPGMKIFENRMLEALKDKGAEVDFDEKVVKFKPQIIEETINLMQQDLKEGRIPKYLNGVTSEKTDDAEIQAKFGGACIQYFDWNNKKYRNPTEIDLINMVKLGEYLSEIKTVGNPVVYLKDKNGNPIEPRMQRIKTAAIVAKYTRKPGSTEVWNAKELEFLIEIGTIVRGSLGEYFKNPCFITAKETIAPLILEEKSAEVLLALAEKGLPCIVIPMPISGISSPVNLFSAAVIGNAEIIATATALKSIYPEAGIIGGVISGSMDMSTGSANFATPEAMLQDLAIAEVHERLYGFNFGLGGYSDAKYPGVQDIMEKEFKYLVLAMSGRYTYPVGLINGGKCFSAEQALMDIQMLENIHKFLEGIVISDEEEILELIRKVGIGGSFLQEEHTLYNYKQYLAVPELFDHTLLQGYDSDIQKDILLKAHQKVDQILSTKDMYEINSNDYKEIDKVVEAAERIL